MKNDIHAMRLEKEIMKGIEEGSTKLNNSLLDYWCEVNYKQRISGKNEKNSKLLFGIEKMKFWDQVSEQIQIFGFGQCK